MATTITVVCPECDKQLRAPDTIVGKKVRCKECGHSFVARSAGKAPAAKGKSGAPAKPAPAKGNKPAPARPKAPANDVDDDGNPYGVTTLDLAPRCPSCANELESEEAVICLFCGYNTRTREHAKTRKVHDTTGGDYFIWLLPGILCALAVLGLLTWDIIYCLKINSWVDVETWYGGLLAHLAIKLWMVIITMFVMWMLGKFAFKRLVLNPHPPEIEKR